MHCRRVRSFLSAYSKGELSEKRSRAIADHLRNCPSCRSEESAAREIDLTIAKMSSPGVSPDFNARLLNRIAEERFSETRSRAYLPRKRVPVVNLTRVLAVAAATCFVFALIFAGGFNNILQQHNDQTQIAETVPLNDDYETVQPQSEHWVFKEQLQRAARIKNLMNRVTGESQFNILTSQGGQNSYNRRLMPIPRQFFQMHRNGSPYYNGTVLPETTTVREVNAEG